MKRINNKLKLVATIVFCGMFLAIIRAYFSATLLGDVYPWNTFLFLPGDRFMDLFNMSLICSTNDPYFTTTPFASNYFPVANTIFYWFSLIENRVWMMVAFQGIFLMVYIPVLKKLFQDQWRSHFLEIIIVFVFSYPVLYNTDRQNIELYNFLCCLLWVYFKEKDKSFLAVFFLALSISMKLYTAVFAIIYIKDMKLKELTVLMSIVAVLTLLSASTFKGGVMNNIFQMMSVQKEFTQEYTSVPRYLHFNHSLFSLIMISITAVFKVWEDPVRYQEITAQILLPYTFLTMAIFGLVAFAVIRKKMDPWMDYFLLTALFLLLPHISYDYKLIFLLIPLYYFLKEEKEYGLLTRLFCIGFGLVLIPHNYYYVHEDVSVAAFIVPSLLMAMMFLILFTAKSPVRAKT